MAYHRAQAQHRHRYVMPHKPLLAFCLALPVFLAGCGTIEKEKKVQMLDAALTTYGEAIRWGYFETAYGFLHPDKRQEIPKHLDNVRVTSYEVLQAPLMKSETEAEQVVRIEYVHKDVQQLRSLSDRERWVYDEATSNWWLDSGVPSFE
ncbi:MAG: hypothetical protein LJE70_08015 [Chromatiaceae bacterium]|jgi:hypothetical protein|nr:hypothetical protein [Chromatiaceae bacterium]